MISSYVLHFHEFLAFMIEFPTILLLFISSRVEISGVSIPAPEMKFSRAHAKGLGEIMPYGERTVTERCVIGNIDITLNLFRPESRFAGKP